MKGNERFLIIGVIFSLMFILVGFLFGIVSKSLIGFIDNSTTGLLMGSVVCVVSLLFYRISCIEEPKTDVIKIANLEVEE